MKNFHRFLIVLALCVFSIPSYSSVLCSFSGSYYYVEKSPVACYVAVGSPPSPSNYVVQDGYVGVCTTEFEVLSMCNKYKMPDNTIVDKCLSGYQSNSSRVCQSVIDVSTCADNQNVVNNVCTNLTCPTGQVAVGHQCVTSINLSSCADNQNVVNNVCTNLTCPTGQVAIGHQCVTPINLSSCADNQSIANNACIDITCPTGQVAIGHICVNVLFASMCADNQNVINNVCTDLNCSTGQVAIAHQCVQKVDLSTCTFDQTVVQNKCVVCIGKISPDGKCYPADPTVLDYCRTVGRSINTMTGNCALNNSSAICGGGSGCLGGYCQIGFVSDGRGGCQLTSSSSSSSSNGTPLNLGTGSTGTGSTGTGSTGTGSTGTGSTGTGSTGTGSTGTGSTGTGFGVVTCSSAGGGCDGTLCFLSGVPRYDLSCTIGSSKFSTPPIASTNLSSCLLLACNDTVQLCLDIQGNSSLKSPCKLGLVPTDVSTGGGTTMSTGTTTGTATNATGSNPIETVDCNLYPLSPACGSFVGKDLPDVNSLIRQKQMYASLPADMSPFQDHTPLSVIHDIFVPSGQCNFASLSPVGPISYNSPPEQQTARLLVTFCDLWDNKGGRSLLGWFFFGVTVLGVFMIWRRTVSRTSLAE